MENSIILSVHTHRDICEMELDKLRLILLNAGYVNVEFSLYMRESTLTEHFVIVCTMDTLKALEKVLKMRIVNSIIANH